MIFLIIILIYDNNNDEMIDHMTSKIVCVRHTFLFYVCLESPVIVQCTCIELMMININYYYNVSLCQLEIV